jgi:hypothetical protein
MYFPLIEVSGEIRPLHCANDIIFAESSQTPSRLKPVLLMRSLTLLLNARDPSWDRLQPGRSRFTRYQFHGMTFDALLTPVP